MLVFALAFPRSAAASEPTDMDLCLEAKRTCEDSLSEERRLSKECCAFMTDLKRQRTGAWEKAIDGDDGLIVPGWAWGILGLVTGVTMTYVVVHR